METTITYVAFVGPKLIAEGEVAEILPVLKQRFDKNYSELVLIFSNETGRQVDFDLRGSLAEVIERATSKPIPGPGRPKLGVVSREITLLPRHWQWLEQQPNGISAALRRLVEAAMKLAPQKEQARMQRDALNNVLTAIAGDRANFEEATRALYSGDIAAFAKLIQKWPKDIREYAAKKVHQLKT
ncbi:MAG: DUF2239 family protein [Deltaproteobacteria bacterium]|nr:DUF2239 family protein [Deltaproteobacteria bacterium]